MLGTTPATKERKQKSIQESIQESAQASGESKKNYLRYDPSFLVLTRRSW
jgi:hypothetical protein